MTVEGSYRIPAPRAAVWRKFLDPEAICRAMPGCDRLEPAGDGSYKAELSIGVAAVRGRYEATIRLDGLREPEGYHMRVEASGAPGFVHADGQLSFSEQGDGTEVAYRFEVQVGGPVAAVGQRVLGGVSRLLIGQFFGAMARETTGAA